MLLNVLYLTATVTVPSFINILISWLSGPFTTCKKCNSPSKGSM